MLRRASSSWSSVPVLGFLWCLLAVVLAACGTTETKSPLAAPSGVTSTAGPGYVTVSWIDNSSDETSFEVYRQSVSAAMKPSQANEPYATVPANTTEYVDMDVELEVGYDYSVVAVRNGTKSGVGTAASTAQVPWGVDLMVGTGDYADALPNGTVFVTYFTFPEAVLADPGVEVSYKVTGPPGWLGPANEVTPAPLWLERSRGFKFTPMLGYPAVAGTYTLSATVDGVNYEATAELVDEEFSLSKSSSHEVLEVTATTVTAEWTPSPEAVREVPLINYPDGSSTWTLSPDFVPGSSVDVWDEFEEGVHILEVVSANSDIVTYPVKVAQFGISYAGVPFAYGAVPLGACSSLDQAVSVPDPSLADAIRAHISKVDGEFTCIDLLALTRLEWIVSDIASLEGLQYAANLHTAILYNNDISDLGPLQNLTNLRQLGLNLNPLSDLSPIAHMNWLTRLEVNLTDVVDVGFLADFTQLHTLYLGYTAVSDVSSLSGLTQLQYLSLQGLGLTDVGFLEDFDDPRRLWLDGNEIGSLLPLVDNPNLDEGDYLGIAYNGLNLEDAGVMAAIQTLLDRGVYVGYEPQE